MTETPPNITDWQVFEMAISRFRYVLGVNAVLHTDCSHEGDLP
jgi:hypothetical protein